ncbi:MAG: DUF4968 domain-containing protein, partial [Cyclobacteriaceae bacterium]|nr:DUF4968 domain-containing protein [Cyclobacteriaceae bacterium]
MPSSLSKRLGQLLSISQNGSDVLGKTSHGNFRVRIFSNAVVQVSISRDDSFEDFSYAVIAKPQQHEYHFHESPDAVEIKTGSLDIRISRNPVAFTFKDAHGIVLNEDEPGLGTSWIGDQVTT